MFKKKKKKITMKEMTKNLPVKMKRKMQNTHPRSFFHNMNTVMRQ